MRSVLTVMTVLIFCVSTRAADFANQFVTAKLAYGAAVSLPRAWSVIDGSDRRALETTVGAAADLTGYAHALEGTDSLLVANFPNQAFYASVTITSTILPQSTPFFLASISEAQLKTMDGALHSGITSMQARLGARVKEWTPAIKTQLAGRTVLLTTYTRSTDSGESDVLMYKVFGSGRLYDIILSSRASAMRTNSLILERIATSFTAP